MSIWKSNRLWGTVVVRKPPAAAPLPRWMWPRNPWHRIHIDFAEDEKRHYFILVDAHSRWPEIFYMLRNTTAASTITILRELFAKYGMPVHCVSDNGPQFRSKEFTHGSVIQEPHEGLQGQQTVNSATNRELPANVSVDKSSCDW